MTRTALTYRDYEALPNDGRRYEIHDGELSVTPSPSLEHQIVSIRLVAALAPDRLGLASQRGIEGPPTLAGEILSPSPFTGLGLVPDALWP
jgi:Uma2 family endonuclease